MTKTLVKFLSLTIITLSILTTSCKKKETSGTTGWNYNDKKWGGFEKLNYEGQATGPNLVLIEGGTFNMGLSDQDVTFEWNNVPVVCRLKITVFIKHIIVGQTCFLYRGFYLFLV